MTKSFRRGSGGKNIGKFVSVRTGRTLMTDSVLEMDHLYWLDSDPEVRDFTTHPFTLSYVADGKLRRYTPDVLVDRGHKRQIVEVKPAPKAAWRRYVLLFRTVAPIFHARGFEFVVVTSEWVQQQPHLDTLKILWKYARTKVEPGHQVLCREFFKTRETATLGEITEYFTARNIAVQIVYSLLFWHVLTFDLAKPLGQSTAIHLGGETSKAEEVL